MQYRRISADCHLDLPWLPPDLFTSQAPREFKHRMPFVEDGADGPRWVTTINKDVGAGFYASVLAPLPFAFGNVPPERVIVYRMGPGQKTAPATE